MLDPGNELIVHHAATPRIDDRATMAIERPASLDTSTARESGQLVLDNETLAIVAQRTNPYTAKPLELANPRIATMSNRKSDMKGTSGNVLDINGGGHNIKK